MSDTTKLDLSRAEWNDIIFDIRRMVGEDAAQQVRALLDAKEAAERERDECAAIVAIEEGRADKAQAQLTEASASAAAAYGEGYRDCAYGERNHHHSATEALRRVKEAAWERGYAIGTNAGVQQTWGDSPNPYAAKEAAHD